jgi:hypothetical protein
VVDAIVVLHFPMATLVFRRRSALERWTRRPSKEGMGPSMTTVGIGFQPAEPRRTVCDADSSSG